MMTKSIPWKLDEICRAAKLENMTALPRHNHSCYRWMLGRCDSDPSNPHTCGVRNENNHHTHVGYAMRTIISPLLKSPMTMPSNWHRCYNQVLTNWSQKVLPNDHVIREMKPWYHRRLLGAHIQSNYPLICVLPGQNSHSLRHRLLLVPHVHPIMDAPIRDNYGM